MLSREEAVAFRLALDTENGRLVAGLIGAVAAVRPRIELPCILDHQPVPQLVEPGYQRRRLAHQELRQAIVVHLTGAYGLRAAGEEIEDAGLARLSAGRVPRRVEADRRQPDLAVAADLVPAPARELQLRLARGPHQQRVDRLDLERPESGLAEIDGNPHHRERHGENDAVVDAIEHPA